MSYTPPVLGFDPSGRLSDNYVMGEIQSPPLAKNRLLVPIYGAFYTHDFSLVDEMTGDPVDPGLYSYGDLDGRLTEETGKSVYTCLIVDQAAPAALRLNYRAVGGPGSRNASFLINMLAERSALSGRTLDWNKTKNKPEHFNPEHHLHLFNHIYGMEYVQEAVDRLNYGIKTGRESMWFEYNFQIDRKLAQLAEHAELVASALATEAFAKVQKELTLYAIGLDLMENYAVLGNQGSIVAPGNFMVETLDERYVDLKGLGSFSKALYHTSGVVHSSFTKRP